MILHVDSTLALPVYEQIREQVIRMVVAGTIEPGTRLPTIRQLASDLQLAKGTVAKAYALLEAGGVLETRGHRGSFVLPIADSSSPASSDIGHELDAAADAFVIAAKQLGVDLGTAADALETRWARF